MTNLIAIAPKEGKIQPYLTNGKEYPIIEWHKKTTEKQDWFSIIDDDGKIVTYCVPKNSLHLYDLNWIIIERP